MIEKCFTGRFKVNVINDVGILTGVSNSPNVVQKGAVFYHLLSIFFKNSLSVSRLFNFKKNTAPIALFKILMYIIGVVKF